LVVGRLRLPKLGVRRQPAHSSSGFLAIPGPQRRGTGGTLIWDWKGHRDRGHPPVDFPSGMQSIAIRSRLLPQRLLRSAGSWATATGVPTDRSSSVGLQSSGFATSLRLTGFHPSAQNSRAGDPGFHPSAQSSRAGDPGLRWIERITSERACSEVDIAVVIAVLPELFARSSQLARGHLLDGFQETVPEESAAVH
jgi:hypothetical protein